MSLVEYGSSDEELDETNEIFTVEQPSSVKDETESKHDLTSLFASLPKPKFSNVRSSDIVGESGVKDIKPTTELSAVCEKKKKQPVKIFVPNLPEFDEDDIPRKRQKSQVSSGLMNMLPAPKNTTLGKAANKLVPHVLTKKPAKTPSVSDVTKTSQSTQNSKTLAMTLVEYDDKDSDDEGNEANCSSDFFSLNSNETNTADVSHIPNVNGGSHTLISNFKAYDVTANYGTSVQDGFNNVNINGEIIGSGQNNLSETSKSTSITNTTFDVTNAAIEEVSGATMQNACNDNGINNIAVDFGQDVAYDVNASSTKPQQICEEYDVVHPSQQHKNFLVTTEPQESIGPVQVTNEIDITDERFLRLQGKKERGKEDIQIIDISADQQLPGVNTALMKGLTEELAYKPSRKKGEMPTSQQRRKHQITYLAFQAKERELELKNQWSTNRMTRRQTQAKYGF